MNITTPTELGILVKTARKQQGLNQTQLAQKIGVTRQWVAAVESGKASVSMGLILDLLTSLGILLTTQDSVQTFSRFFAEGLAKKIAEGPSKLNVGEGEEREAAVLVIDLRGFTQLTRHIPPNEVMAILGEYQTIVVQNVGAYQGDIDKFMGDGILVSFGAVSATSSYAADALMCAQNLLHELDVWRKARQAEHKPAPDIGMGIAVGKVIFGIVGNDQRMEFTLIGEAVNLAAKLEKHTRKEHAHVITTKKTLDLAVLQGYDLKAPPKIVPQVMLRGMQAGMDLVVLCQ